MGSSALLHAAQGAIRKPAQGKGGTSAALGIGRAKSQAERAAQPMGQGDWRDELLASVWQGRENSLDFCALRTHGREG